MPTIKDVAVRCGVAKSTVSNVINGKGNISEAVRSKVLEAIEEMGYTPSSIARSLSMSKNSPIKPLASTKIILASPRYSPLYDVSLAMTCEFASLLTKNLGLCGISVEISTDTNHDTLNINGNTIIELDWISSLSLVLVHMKELGHRSICLVPLGIKKVDDLLRAAARALESDGISINIAPPANTLTDGLTFVRNRPNVSGIIFAHPAPAVGYLLSANSAERVSSLSIACLVDTWMSKETIPALTAVRHDFNNISTMIAEMYESQVVDAPASISPLPVLNIRHSTDKVKTKPFYREEDLLD